MRLYIFCSTCKIYCSPGNENEEGRYSVQTRSKAKSSGLMLPDIHGIDKEMDPNSGPKKNKL